MSGDDSARGHAYTRTTTITQDYRRGAVRCVLRNAHDAGDAHRLLDVLGLLDEAHAMRREAA